MPPNDFLVNVCWHEYQYDHSLWIINTNDISEKKLKIALLTKL